MTAFEAAEDTVAHLPDEEIWQYSENEAKKTAEKLCIRPWREAVGKVPLMVSSGQLYFFEANRMNDVSLVGHS